MARTNSVVKMKRSPATQKQKVIRRKGPSNKLKKTSLYRNARAISTFLRADAYVQESMLNGASKSFIQTWVDLILDVLKGNVTISRDQYDQLECVNHHIEQFKAPETPLPIKRYLLKQKGGFLPILTGIIKPLLGTILGSVFK